MIYMIIGPSGKKYIGQTVKDFGRRWSAHLWSAKNDSKKSAIHSAINKYEGKGFNFAILCMNVPDQREANMLEIYFINLYGTYKNGYNLTKGGLGNTGYKATEETKRKLSASHLGQIQSESNRLALSIANTGKVMSEETRKKLSLVLTGKVRSPEVIRNMSEARRGVKMGPPTEETKRKISKALKKRIVNIYSEDGIITKEHGRTCRGCREFKNNDEYYRSGLYTCKECVRKRERERSRNNENGFSVS